MDSGGYQLRAIAEPIRPYGCTAWARDQGPTALRTGAGVRDHSVRECRFTCLQVHVVGRRKLLALAQLLQALPSVRHQGRHLHALCCRHAPARRLHPAAAGRGPGSKVVSGEPRPTLLPVTTHATHAAQDTGPASPACTPPLPAHAPTGGAAPGWPPERCRASRAGPGPAHSSRAQTPPRAAPGQQGGEGRSGVEQGGKGCPGWSASMLVSAETGWHTAAHTTPRLSPGAPPAALCCWPAGRCRR